MSDKQGPQDRSTDTPSPAGLSVFGLQFAVALIGFGYAGNWLDGKLHVSPLFLMAGVFLGGGGVFYTGIKRLTGNEGSSNSSSKAPSNSRSNSSSQVERDTDADSDGLT